jgi:hypothetical protein
MRALVFVVAVMAVASPAAAQQHPDLSGMWLVQDPGSGDWSAFFLDNVPKPQLQPAIVKENAEMLARESDGYVVNRTTRTASCPFGNLPMMMASSPPLNIVASKDEILIGAESNRGRFVYMDRPHADVKAPGYVPTGFGDSIGRWDGDTLVVDTIGFAPRVCDSRRPVMLTPGWGRAKDTTHLVERYRLANPDELSVTFTWEDPTVWVAPYTYSYTYKRVAEGTPVESTEDPSRELPQRLNVTDKVEK